MIYQLLCWLIAWKSLDICYEMGQVENLMNAQKRLPWHLISFEQRNQCVNSIPLIIANKTELITIKKGKNGFIHVSWNKRAKASQIKMWSNSIDVILTRRRRQRQKKRSYEV